MRKVLCLTVCFLQTSCLSALLGRQDGKSRDYYFPEPGNGWEVIDPAESDAAYRNRVDHSILNVSSNCGEDRFRSLEDLSNDVFKQLPEREVVDPPKAINVGGHPALVTEVKGKVDGSDLNVRLVVVRTPDCLFDIMVAGSQLDKSSRMAFDEAIAGFRDKKQ